MSIGCIIHSKYRSKLSSTYKKIGTPCKIPIGDGAIYDFFSQDCVKIGDMIIRDQVTLLNPFKFAEITKEGSLEFLAMHFDGILLLGFRNFQLEKSHLCQGKMDLEFFFFLFSV